MKPYPPQFRSQRRHFTILALILCVNAAISGKGKKLTFLQMRRVE